MNFLAGSRKSKSVAFYKGDALHILGKEIDFDAMDRTDSERPGAIMDASTIEANLNQLEADLRSNGNETAEVRKVIVARWSAAKLIREGALDPTDIAPRKKDGRVVAGIGTVSLPSGREFGCQVDTEAYDGEWDFWVVDGPGPFDDGVQARNFQETLRTD